MNLPEPGRRVTVRSVVAGTRRTTDVIGWLLEVGDVELVVEQREGEVVRIPRATVQLVRVVPDRPRRSRPAAAISDDDLARITSIGWPAAEWVPLGEWELRAAGGFTSRANSAALIGDPGVPIAEALDALRAFYASRNLPARAQVTVGSPWEQELVTAGWTSEAGVETLVRVADLAEAPTAEPGVRQEVKPDDPWLAVYGRDGDAAATHAVLTGPPRVNLLAIGAPPVAVGRAVATGEWLGIASMAVMPEQRRTGLARAIVDTALAWGVRQGCTKAYLQVEADNAPALRLYESYGFTTHHSYRYWQPVG